MVEVLAFALVAVLLGWSSWMLRAQNRELGHTLLRRDADAKAERELLLAMLERVTAASAGRETAAIEAVLDRLGYGSGPDEEAESVEHVSEDDEINEARQKLVSEVDQELQRMAALIDNSDAT